jgi:hypothetical protein
VADIRELVIDWSGSGVVGPGASVLHFRDADVGAPGALVTLFNTLKGGIPSGTQIVIPSSGQTVDDTTGQVTGSWVESGGTTLAASGSASFVQGVGARIVWLTESTINGRLHRGSTFIVPISNDQFAGAGALADTLVSTWNTAVSNFVSAVAGNFIVWRRPRQGSFSAISDVSSGFVPDKVSWLRSRRT